jgi:hypothetical protein
MVKATEQAARLGIPMQFEIQLKDGHYSFGLTEVLKSETGMKPEAPLHVFGEHTLGFLPDKQGQAERPKDIPPLLLIMPRPDQIRGEYTFDNADTKKPEDPHMKYTISWTFKRVKS